MSRSVRTRLETVAQHGLGDDLGTEEDRWHRDEAVGEGAQPRSLVRVVEWLLVGAGAHRRVLLGPVSQCRRAKCRASDTTSSRLSTASTT